MRDMENYYLAIPGFPDYRICYTEAGTPAIESRKRGYWKPMRTNKRKQSVNLTDEAGNAFQVRIRRTLYAAERGFNPLDLPRNVNITLFRGRLQAVANGIMQGEASRKNAASPEQRRAMYSDMAAFCGKVLKALDTGVWSEVALAIYACKDSLDAYLKRNRIAADENNRAELCAASCEMLLNGIKTLRITTARPEKALRQISRNLAARAKARARMDICMDLEATKTSKPNF